MSSWSHGYRHWICFCPSLQCLNPPPPPPPKCTFLLMAMAANPTLSLSMFLSQSPWDLSEKPWYITLLAPQTPVNSGTVFS